VTADRQREVTAQRQAVLDHPVGVPGEELNRLHAHDMRATALLLGPQRPGLGRWTTVDAGLAPCDKEVRDLLPGVGPRRDRRRRAVLRSEEHTSELQSL